jgi:3-ketosteroid 9alpha-monooxygenase subunit B
VAVAVSPGNAPERVAVRDHKFHGLRIQTVIRETDDASSFVLDVPDELRDAFAYEAGQFLTFRVRIHNEVYLRSYSMSSSPEVGDAFQITVKRVPGGAVSNWMIDTLGSGDVVEATCPAGVFCLGPDEGDVVAFSGGSGITPVFSIVKTTLATTARRVHLLYANRDRDSIIFGEALDDLVARYPGRLNLAHRLDVEHGFVDDAAVRSFAADVAAPQFYICGPGPFMDIVEGALLGNGVDEGQIHIERFTPAVPPAAPDAPVATGKSRVTIELDGRTDTVDHRAGTTILQTARQMGMAPPFSCEAGSCATCMAKLVEGEVAMHVNNALTDDEVADGWVLTCQSVPKSPSVRVIYGYEGA